MKLKALMVALFVAGLSSSMALADGGHGNKGHENSGGKAAALSSTTTGQQDHNGGHGKSLVCRPSIELEVAGTVASAPSGGSIALLVTKGGAEGAQLAGKQLTLDVSQAKGATGLTQGAAVRVHARACVDLVAGTVKIVATQVGGGSHEQGDGAKTSTSGSTTTTTSSSTTTTTTSSSTTTNG